MLLPLLIYGWLVWDHGHAWDDWLILAGDIHQLQGEALWRRIMEPVLWGSSYFRPLVLGSYAAEWHFHGGQAFWAHAVNVGLHGLNTALVFGLAVAVMRSESGAEGILSRPARALLAAIAYAMHPALVEPVAWISGRFDLMVTSFMLAGLLIALQPVSAKRNLAFALSFLCALLSKEMAITLPVLALLLRAWVAPAGTPLLTSFRDSLRERGLWAGAALALLGYLALRFGALGLMLGSLDTPNQGDLLQRLALGGAALALYLRSTWLPFFGLSPVHPIQLQAMSQAELVAGVLAMLVTAIGLALLLLRRPQHALLPALVLWAVALAPVLHLIPLPIRDNLGHERFLALPLALWSLSLTRLGRTESNRRWMRLLLAPMVIWLLGSLAMVRSTAPMWANDLSLWAWAYELHPDSELVANNYLGAAQRYGQTELATRLAAQTEGRFPGRMALTIASFRLSQGDASGALRVLLEFERISAAPHANHDQDVTDLVGRPTPQNFLPTVPMLYTGLAGAYLQLHQYERAERMARIARWYRPEYALPVYLQSLALHGQGRGNEADAVFARIADLEGASQQAGFARSRAQFLKQLCQEFPERGDCKKPAP